MPALNIRDLARDPKFRALAPADREQVFGVIAQRDAEFSVLPPADQAQVREITLSGALSGVPQAQVPNFLQRLQRRVGAAAESANQIVDLRGGIRSPLVQEMLSGPGDPRARLGQAALKAISGLFSPVSAALAPVGAAVENAAAGVGASEPVAEAIGTGAEALAPVGVGMLQQAGKLAPGMIDDALSAVTGVQRPVWPSGTTAARPEGFQRPTGGVLGEGPPRSAVWPEAPPPEPPAMPAQMAVGAGPAPRPSIAPQTVPPAAEIPGQARAADIQPPSGRIAEAAPSPVMAQERPNFELLEGGKPEGFGKAPPSAPELTEPLLKENISHRLVEASEDLFRSGKLQRDPDRLISDQVMEAISSEQVPLMDVAETLKRHNLSFVDLAQEMFRPAVSDAARRLQALSVLSRRINMLAQDPAGQKELASLKALSADFDVSIPVRSIWQRVNNVRRGALVTQLSTAVRNFISQTGRLGVDVFDQGLQAGFQAVGRWKTGKAPAEPVRALDGLESLLNVFRRGTKQDVDLILSRFQTERDRLFQVYASDVARKAVRERLPLGFERPDSLLERAETAVEALNVFNRFQEFVVRRGVFMAKLSQQLRNRGQNLTEIVARNDVGKIAREDVEAAVGKALEMTFSQRPEHGSVAQKFVSLANSSPLTLVIPFPRFMVNSLRFLYEHSPAGFLRLLSSREQAQIAAGNMEVLSRATLGSAMLLSAYQAQKEFGGERWYELRVPGADRKIDIRAYNPFAAFSYVAHQVLRKREAKPGPLERVEAADIIKNVAGVNLRAGVGLEMVQQIVQGLGELGRTERMGRLGKRVAGEVAGGLLVPLGTVSDVLAEFDESLAVQRDTRQKPFLGPIKNRLPFEEIPGTGIQGRKSLPERESSTREAVPRAERPALRQLAGLTLQEPKNAIEKELDRLQFNSQEIQPSTGEPEADALVAKHLGPIVEQRLGALIEQDRYKKLSEKGKGAVLQKVLSLARKAAIANAKAENPALMRTVSEARYPSRLREAVEEWREGRRP